MGPELLEGANRPAAVTLALRACAVAGSSGTWDFSSSEKTIDCQHRGCGTIDKRNYTPSKTGGWATDENLRYGNVADVGLLEGDWARK